MEGYCDYCEGKLTGKQKRWDSDNCRVKFNNQRVSMRNRLNAGGIIIGPSHAQDGVTCTVDNGLYFREIEGNEYHLSYRLMKDPTIYTYEGTPQEIFVQMITNHGEIPTKMPEGKCKLTTGDVIITKSAVMSENSHTLTGTNKEIASALNSEYAGKSFAPGADTMVEGGPVEQERQQIQDQIKRLNDTIPHASTRAEAEGLQAEIEDLEDKLEDLEYRSVDLNTIQKIDSEYKGGAGNSDALAKFIYDNYERIAGKKYTNYVDMENDNNENKIADMISFYKIDTDTWEEDFKRANNLTELRKGGPVNKHQENMNAKKKKGSIVIQDINMEFGGPVYEYTLLETKRLYNLAKNNPDQTVDALIQARECLDLFNRHEGEMHNGISADFLANEYRMLAMDIASMITYAPNAAVVYTNMSTGDKEFAVIKSEMSDGRCNILANNQMTSAWNYELTPTPAMVDGGIIQTERQLIKDQIKRLNDTIPHAATRSQAEELQAEIVELEERLEGLESAPNFFQVVEFEDEKKEAIQAVSERLDTLEEAWSRADISKGQFVSEYADRDGLAEWVADYEKMKDGGPVEEKRNLGPLYTGAEVSRQIKRELKASFPGIKFSVRYSSYAGGDSVYAAWNFGPTKDEVGAIIDKFQYGSFNSMEDIYEYDRKHAVDPEGDLRELGGVKYVSSTRTYHLDNGEDHNKNYENEIDPQTEIAKYLAAEYGYEWKGRRETRIEGANQSIYDSDTYRLLGVNSFKTDKVISIDGLVETGATSGTVEELFKIKYNGDKVTINAIAAERITTDEEWEKNRPIREAEELAMYEAEADRLTQYQKDIASMQIRSFTTTVPSRLQNVEWPQLNKNNTIGEYRQIQKEEIEEGLDIKKQTEIQQIIIVNDRDWNVLMNNLMDSFPTIWNKVGGSHLDDDLAEAAGITQDKLEIFDLTETQKDFYRANSYRLASLVFNEDTGESAVVDVSGHDYARYLGFPMDKEEVQTVLLNLNVTEKANIDLTEKTETDIARARARAKLKILQLKKRKMADGGAVKIKITKANVFEHAMDYETEDFDEYALELEDFESGEIERPPGFKTDKAYENFIEKGKVKSITEMIPVVQKRIDTEKMARGGPVGGFKYGDYVKIIKGLQAGRSGIVSGSAVSGTTKKKFLYVLMTDEMGWATYTSVYPNELEKSSKDQKLHDALAARTTGPVSSDIQGLVDAGFIKRKGMAKGGPVEGLESDVKNHLLLLSDKRLAQLDSEIIGGDGVAVLAWIKQGHKDGVAEDLARHIIEVDHLTDDYLKRIGYTKKHAKGGPVEDLETVVDQVYDQMSEWEMDLPGRDHDAPSSIRLDLEDAMELEGKKMRKSVKDIALDMTAWNDSFSSAKAKKKWLGFTKTLKEAVK